MIELRCSRDIADRFDIIEPDSPAHHRALRDAGHMRVRDCETGRARFWPWQLDLLNETIASMRSS